MRFANSWSRSTLVFLLLSVFIVALFSLKSLYLGKTVYGDGIFYYSWLKSIVIDHDVSFVNEYAHFGVTQLPTNVGLIGNQFAIGPAVFWAPVFIWIHSLVKGNGYTFLYEYGVGLMSVGYVIVALILLFRLFTKYYSSNLSLLTVITLCLGTNIFFYGALDTVNSHAISFFVSSLLLTLLVEQKQFFFMGLSAGLLGAIRIQDSLFIFFPLFSIFFIFFQHYFSRKIAFTYSQVEDVTKKTMKICLGFFIPIIGQFIAWYMIYGDVRIPYLERGYGFNFFESSFLSVLFSPHHGLFLWTPLVAFACIGLIMKKPTVLYIISLATIIFFLWQTYLIGSWSIWWQGASFSGRMFISMLPFLSLGGIAMLQTLPTKSRYLSVFLFCLLNMILSVYYLLTT